MSIFISLCEHKPLWFCSSLENLHRYHFINPTMSAYIHMIHLPTPSKKRKKKLHYIIATEQIHFAVFHICRSGKRGSVFIARVQLPGDGGQVNKDSISLLADRQLRKYLQPHCNAAKWTLRDRQQYKKSIYIYIYIYIRDSKSTLRKLDRIQSALLHLMMQT